MQIFRFPFKAMACSCEVVLAHVDFAKAKDIADQAIAEVARIQNKYSRYQEQSVVSEINRAAGKSAIDCDAETWTLLGYAETLFQSSGGLFDITAGILRRAWNFTEPRLPTRTALASLCALIDWSSVERSDQKIRLPQCGMELDFGGFGKEYAADRAAKTMVDNAIQYGYVNLGGDIRILGPKPDGQAWQIGIQHPRDPNQLLASIPIERGALATSGDYQRFVDIDGRRYCHILDPRTGLSVSHWQSITVLAPLATMAGSCSTIGMLMQEHCLDFLQKTGVSYLAVDSTGQVHKSALAIA